MSVTFSGDKELLNALEKNWLVQRFTKRLLRKSGRSTSKDSSTQSCDFKKGYSTGATKRSIKLDLASNGLRAVVKANTDYSGYLEVGTRKMEAQPFMQPAFNEIQPKFIDDLRRAGIVK